MTPVRRGAWRSRRGPLLKGAKDIPSRGKTSLMRCAGRICCRQPPDGMSHRSWQRVSLLSSGVDA